MAAHRLELPPQRDPPRRGRPRGGDSRPWHHAAHPAGSGRRRRRVGGGERDRGCDSLERHRRPGVTVESRRRAVAVQEESGARNRGIVGKRCLDAQRMDQPVVVPSAPSRSGRSARVVRVHRNTRHRRCGASGECSSAIRWHLHVGWPRYPGDTCGPPTTISPSTPAATNSKLAAAGSRGSPRAPRSARRRPPDGMPDQAGPRPRASRDARRRRTRSPRALRSAPLRSCRRRSRCGRRVRHGAIGRATGAAPAHRRCTRGAPSRRAPSPAAWAASRSATIGDATTTSTRCVRICAARQAASSRARRPRLPSGTTHVAPAPSSARTANGSIDRCTSPARSSSLALEHPLHRHQHAMRSHGGLRRARRAAREGHERDGAGIAVGRLALRRRARCLGKRPRTGPAPVDERVRYRAQLRDEPAQCACGRRADEAAYPGSRRRDGELLAPPNRVEEHRGEPAAQERARHGEERRAERQHDDDRIPAGEPGPREQRGEAA